MPRRKITPERELAKSVQELSKVFKLYISFKRRFFLGIVFGLGSALGATVIAAIVLIILSRLIQATGIDAIVGQEIIQTIQ
jgi:hypothetical protein